MEIEFRTGVIHPVECFKEGWELIKDQYWLLFGITLVGAMMGGASFYIVLGAMICGIFYCYFQKIDGKPVRFDDLFKGFEYFSASILLVLIIVLPTLVVLAIVYAPFVAALIVGQNLSGDGFLSLLVGGFAVDFIAIVLMTCFHTLLIFAFPLLVDRKVPAWQAVKTSARAVWANLSGVAGLFGIGFLLNIVGLLVCFVGVYFTIPIIIAGNVVAYRKIFPAGQNSNQPPPPDAYRGAGSYN
ncbi:MAG TPA: hypothetical protein VGC76_20060 [Pyrinomonadaceae bacterium]|jgi:hypothetical protein